MASKVTIKIPKDFSSQTELITRKLASKQLENIAKDTEKKDSEKTKETESAKDEKSNMDPSTNIFSENNTEEYSPIP